eukprot:6684081-Lingulodinium_polyedra.AAC.1
MPCSNELSEVSGARRAANLDATVQHSLTSLSSFDQGLCQRGLRSRAGPCRAWPQAMPGHARPCQAMASP